MSDRVESARENASADTLEKYWRDVENALLERQQMRWLVAAHDRVAAKTLVIDVGEVERVVQAAALAAEARALDDQLREIRDVAQLEQVERDEVAPVVLADLFLE